MPGRSLALAALAGALLALSLPPFDLPLLAWTGLVPLLAGLRGRTLRQGFRLGGVAGIILFCGTLYWVAHPLQVHGRLPLPAASLVTLLLCAYCALYPALFGAGAVLLRERRLPLFPVAAAALWTGLELVRTHLLTGFPWSLLGYSQHSVLPVIQIADLTGVYGVSYLVVLVNIAIAELIADRRRFLPLTAAALALVLVLAYGRHRLGERPGHDGLRIAVIQGNIDQSRKWDPDFRSEVFAAYQRLTRDALTARPDLIIWPETSTPFYFDGPGETDRAMTAELRELVRKAGVPLLLGSPTLEKDGLRYRLRNSAFFLDRAGRTSQVYHKLHLVPFGEYAPLRGLLFFTERLVQAPGDFEAGSEHTLAEVRGPEGGVLLGTVICYEIIFPDLVRRFAARGAAVMTTITNDAWFGRTGMPAQHFAMAVLRAVENRVPVARAANTGISGFIDARGRVLERSPLFTEAVLVRDLAPAGKARTFYTRNGDVFGALCLLVGISLLAFPSRRPPALPDEAAPPASGEADTGDRAA